MKVPLKWLQEYVPLTLPVAELAERLTLAGLEVSGVRLIGVPTPEGLRVKSEEAGPVWDRDKIVIAQVVSVEKHPNADKLKLPTVDYGQGRTKKMVTGAPNLNVGDAGQKVILALAGAVLYDGHATPKKLSELKPGKIRGEPSDAMVCSSFELGIDEEHEGIILLEADAPVGTPLVDFMGDVVLELEVTPNLARALSLIGVAREVAALTGQTLKLPHTPSQPSPDAGGGQGGGDEPVEGQVRVVIEDPKLSSRYAAMLLKGVKIGPAPGWMQRRLTYAGMRPISNVVDITNYVMLEWGQPLHAFDYDKLTARAGGKAPTITVRPARAGEVLKTLDGVDRCLTPEMLVIADDAGPVALAGVMGGAETEVSATTTNVLLESANFDFLNIRRTIKALNLPSEASMRFSRGIHPELVKPAAERAAELMRRHAGAVVCQGMVDVYPAPPTPQIVELQMSEVRRILGMDFPVDEAARVLRALEFRVEPKGEALVVTAPPHRLDIQEGPADLIEDLARLHGYDRLPATLLADRLPPQTGNPPLEFEERVRDLLVGAGLQETINYALTTPEREELLGVKPAEYVRLLNPISSERSVMRQSVLASVLDAAAANLKHTHTVRLFEIGKVYLPRSGQRLPDEPRRLAVVLCGKRHPDSWQDSDSSIWPPLDFFDLKGVVEALIEELHIPKALYRPTKVPAVRPGRAAELTMGDQMLGYFGELHPKIVPAFGLCRLAPTLVAEFDLEALQAATPARHGYAPIPRFPAALRDVAVIVPEATPADQIESEIRAGGGDLLNGVRLFDLYRGESIGAGVKSLAYALTYQADDRTLTDKEVDRAHKKIQERLKHVLKARIRGE